VSAGGAQRRLDAEIYYVVLDEVDVNALGTDTLFTAASDGDVLLRRRGTSGAEWYVFSREKYYWRHPQGDEG
jgi:hypothetical protein